ncbi:MAG: hypothetical protein ABI232_13425 [Jatrophihabitantaceae bacterium]
MPASIHLARTPLMRAVGGQLLQPLFLLVAVFGFLGAIINSKQGPAPLIIAILAVVLWLVSATASAEADDNGMRWRCYLRHELPWSEITDISLHLQVFGWQGARPVILVRTVHRTLRLVPATGHNSANVTFCRELRALAAAHGVQVDTSGWSEAYL